MPDAEYRKQKQNNQLFPISADSCDLQQICYLYILIIKPLMKKLLPFITVLAAFLQSCSDHDAYIVSTTADVQWAESFINAHGPSSGTPESLTVMVDSCKQTIKGFGTCFSELSARALSKLSEEDYQEVMAQLFDPEAGAAFTICRTPLACSDFALEYYSYNDVAGDLAMKNFSVAHDEALLIPLIKDALVHNPAMKIWASPWCPPQWMKVNRHYASRPLQIEHKHFEGRLELNNIVTDNGVTEETTMHEGEDSFILDGTYLEAYALYFKRYVQEYRKRGIDIFMVMPQNEFNSDQNFPSCTWTPQGLLRFMKVLVPAMEEEGVEVYFGTMERPDRSMADVILQDPEVGPEIHGAAFQWAGRAALPAIHESYPDLTMVMSEQQCFGGANSWEDFMAAWDLLKDNIDNGVSIYDYWNLALFKDEVSTWGWKQNSLISVDYGTGKYHYNYEFYEMKHISRFVKPGAVCLGTAGYPEALAFRNTDGSIAVLVAEKEGSERALTISVGKKAITATIPANSLSTIVL